MEIPVAATSTTLPSATPSVATPSSARVEAATETDAEEAMEIPVAATSTTPLSSALPVPPPNEQSVVAGSQPSATSPEDIKKQEELGTMAAAAAWEASDGYKRWEASQTTNVKGLSKAQRDQLFEDSQIPETIAKRVRDELRVKALEDPNRFAANFGFKDANEAASSGFDIDKLVEMSTYPKETPFTAKRDSLGLKARELFNKTVKDYVKESNTNLQNLQEGKSASINIVDPGYKTRIPTTLRRSETLNPNDTNLTTRTNLGVSQQTGSLTTRLDSVKNIEEAKRELEETKRVAGLTISTEQEAKKGNNWVTDLGIYLVNKASNVGDDREKAQYTLDLMKRGMSMQEAEMIAAKEFGNTFQQSDAAVALAEKAIRDAERQLDRLATNQTTGQDLDEKSIRRRGTQVGGIRETNRSIRADAVGTSSADRARALEKTDASAEAASKALVTGATFVAGAATGGAAVPTIVAAAGQWDLLGNRYVTPEEAAMNLVSEAGAGLVGIGVGRYFAGRTGFAGRAAEASGFGSFNSPIGRAAAKRTKPPKVPFWQEAQNIVDTPVRYPGYVRTQDPDWLLRASNRSPDLSSAARKRAQNIVETRPTATTRSVFDPLDPSNTNVTVAPSKSVNNFPGLMPPSQTVPTNTIPMPPSSVSRNAMTRAATRNGDLYGPSSTNIPGVTVSPSTTTSNVIRPPQTMSRLTQRPTTTGSNPAAGTTRVTNTTTPKALPQRTVTPSTAPTTPTRPAQPVTARRPATPTKPSNPSAGTTKQTASTSSTKSPTGTSQSTKFIIDPNRKPSITDPDYVEYYSQKYKDTEFFKEAVELLQKRSIAWNRLNGNTNRDANRRASDLAWKEFLARTKAQGLSTGGLVYADKGTLVPYQPKGTDTVPAMLTPGEFVINRQSTQKYKPVLEAINSGNYSRGGIVNYLKQGGYITPRYFQEAGSVAPKNAIESFDFTGYLNNMVGQITSSITQAFEKATGSLKQPNNSSAGVSNNTADLANIDNFVNRLNNIANILSNIYIPPQITITGKHDVVVTINGDATLQQLEPNIKQIVMGEINRAMNNLKANNPQSNIQFDGNGSNFSGQV